MTCDLNCDMGEGMGNEEAIMPFITSANIACGFHAGDQTTMRYTLLLTKKYGVHAGVHPSYPDRENFGRTEMHSSPEEVYDWVVQQIRILKKVAGECMVPLHHIKPHGALYNRAAKDAAVAKAIAQAVRDEDKKLILYGLSGSCSISEAEALGLSTASEVFADRTYQDDGSLTPRSLPNSLIEEEEQAIRQVVQMVQHKTVATVSGKSIPIKAETICIHGDGQHAIEFAQKIKAALQRYKNSE